QLVDVLLVVPRRRHAGADDDAAAEDLLPQLHLLHPLHPRQAVDLLDGEDRVAGGDAGVHQVEELAQLALPPVAAAGGADARVNQGDGPVQLDALLAGGLLGQLVLAVLAVAGLLALEGEAAVLYTFLWHRDTRGSRNGHERNLLSKIPGLTTNGKGIVLQFH